jgi:putative ABC transport system permease protein
LAYDSRACFTLYVKILHRRDTSFWARAAEDSSIAEVEREIVSGFHKRYPNNADVRIQAATAMSDGIRKEAVRLIYLLGLIAGACALLGSAAVFDLIQLQLEARRLELAVRRAVGATQSWVIGLGAREGLLVAACASPLGLALGLGGMALLVVAMSIQLGVVSLQHLACATATLLALAAGSGSVAGWRASTGTPAEALRKGRE